MQVLHRLGGTAPSTNAVTKRQKRSASVQLVPTGIGLAAAVQLVEDSEVVDIDTS
jgi:hypothetical protein